MGTRAAAIYARKSTEQRVSAESKSTTRQVESARAFAAARGWTVAPRHVFIDDAISGAEFARRPGLQAMLAAALRGDFGVLVVAEQKALGREMIEVGSLIKRLSQVGVEVWSYLDERSLTPRGATDKLLLTVQGFADEDARVRSAQRTHESLVKHARAGHVAGGRTFGYRNRPVYSGKDSSGNPLRSHVEREVDAAEARVVRRIFSLFADGHGLKRIARTLNEGRAPAPKYTARSGVAALGRWSPGTVRAILDRDLYRGVVTWNRRRKRDTWGQKKTSWRPEAEVVRVEDERLRIVPQELWDRVQARRRTTGERATRSPGRPSKGKVRNLLAGLASCSVCGGGLVAESSGGPRRGERYAYYQCGRRRHHGAEFCSNTMRLPVAEVNERVLQAVEEHVLRPGRVEEFLLAVEREDSGEGRADIERALRDLDGRIARLVAAVEEGEDVAPLVARLREAQAQRAGLAERLQASQPVPRLKPAVVESRLAEWRRRLRGDVAAARDVLTRALSGRIIFAPWPNGQGAEFEAPTRFADLFVAWSPVAEPFAGVVEVDGVSHVVAEGSAEVVQGSGLGLESLYAETAASERSYEEILRAAEARMEKGWQPRRDSNPRSSP